VPRNWDEHYSDPGNIDWTPDPLLLEAAEWLPPGDALDLACGAGRNALYLAKIGWRVTAVDASHAAIDLLRRRSAGRAIELHTADLEAGGFRISPESYDLVFDFYYLQRNLFPHIRQGVRLGGVFTGAIHLPDKSGSGPPRNPAFLLQPGELREAFAGWKILYYSESARPPGRPAARIIARRA
jgi:tellurite methyltransferase